MLLRNQEYIIIIIIIIIIINIINMGIYFDQGS